MATKKRKKSTPARRKSRTASKKKSAQLKLDPRVSFFLKVVGGFALIVYLFFSVFSSSAGGLGSLVKWLLCAFVGDGVYYVPILLVYIMIMNLIYIKTGESRGKIITAFVMMPVIAMAGHVLHDCEVADLSLKAWGTIMQEAQLGNNGGLLGSYLGSIVTGLLGWADKVFVVLVLLGGLFVMFNEIIGTVFGKFTEWFRKTFLQKKTSKIFRVPGVETDKVRSDEVIREEIKRNTLDVDITMDIAENADVIIEKFATPEDDLKDPELMSATSAQSEPNKKPALSNQEIASVAQELNEAKEQEVKEYIYPSIDFLNKGINRPTGLTKEELNENAIRLVTTLREFGVEAEVVSVQEGPSVTRYEIRPQVGVKISKIMGLSDDIALRMAAKGIRIAPVPGKTVIGVEIANQKVMPVFVRDVIASSEFMEHKSKVSFAVGKDIAGTTVVGDIAKMPHCLIAGATGSGKSVCINSLITSILYKASPEEVKMIMIDPKVVELSVYNGIPHLLIPVVTDPRKAAGALNWAVMEMLNRYNLFEKANVRDLDSYNEHQVANGENPLPKIVIIVDELADLMMASPKEVEEYICRLAQLARAAGMHLIIATQRPSVDVITGLIKANMPSRIAFAVSSQIDSRTILDMGGAEKLLGKGDMLYAPIGESKPIRVQGALITDKEVEQIVDFLKQNTEANYDDDVISHIETAGAKDGPSATSDAGDADQMLPDCIEFVVELGEASVSKLQRRFKLGYSRAARIVDQMEERGIVGPSEGSKPRQVLITKEQYYEMKLNEGM
ncbi:MAG: DNA translocase FtsK [Ruminococcaceae bacterium]|nr:DNA translocase FtsK [Oscillospiraceae bacterium]